MAEQTNTPMLCGLIGEHLGHSFSPQIHRELADYPYGLYEIEREALGEFMKTTELSAFNVTIPYKKDVIPYMEEISDEARRIGAVNTVTRLPSGGFRGDNTDYYGFSYLLDFAGVDVLFGENNTPIICEVNSNPHFKSTYDCTGIDLAEHIFDMIIKDLEK